MSGTADSIRVLMASMPAVERARMIRDWVGEAAPAQEADRIIRRREMARLLARSTRSVDYLVEQGVLRRITLPGRSRGAGFRLSEVQGLIGGKAVPHV